MDTWIPNLPLLFPFLLSLPALARTRRVPAAAAPSSCVWVPFWLLPQRFHTLSTVKNLQPLRRIFLMFLE